MDGPAAEFFLRLMAGIEVVRFDGRNARDLKLVPEYLACFRGWIRGITFR